MSMDVDEDPWTRTQSYTGDTQEDEDEEDDFEEDEDYEYVPVIKVTIVNERDLESAFTMMLLGERVLI